MKFHDVDIDDAVVSVAGTIQAGVNLIPQGVTEKTRVGRKCVIRKIQWRWSSFLPSTSTPGSTTDVVRMILYQDKQANGAAAGVTDILETDDYQSFLNLANSGRFKILVDRLISHVSKSGAYDGTNDQFGENVVNGSYYKNCFIPIEFDSTTGAVTEIKSNNLGVLLVGQTGVATFNSAIRLRFSD